MGHLLLEHLKGWPLEGVLQKKFFFFENALSGSIHSTYQLASLQTDQNPPLGQPSAGGGCKTLPTLQRGVVCDTGGRAAAGLIIIIIIILLTLNTAYPGSIWARDQPAAGWSYCYWVVSSAGVYRVT